MDKVYKRLNWNTTCCNGSMDPDRYLHTQIARAICQAAYEKPLTVEEISLCTGIPAMYIEDELPRLLYGDAVCQTGNKYAANFILFRLSDRKAVEGVSAPLAKALAEQLAARLQAAAAPVSRMDFYGHDFGMERLGHILIPCLLRRKIRDLKNSRLGLENGPFPLRQDGGYGWFVVEETAEESEGLSPYSTGCNVAGEEDGSGHATPSHIYYYWIGRYFDNAVYHNGGTRWLCASGIPQNSPGGLVDRASLSDEDAVRLLRNNRIVHQDGAYTLNFPCFTQEQFAQCLSYAALEETPLEDELTQWIGAVRRSFEGFVPSRLADQINQWVSYYLFQMVGYVTEALIQGGVLRTPPPDKPLTDGVFYVEGAYIEP